MVPESAADVICGGDEIESCKKEEISCFEKKEGVHSINSFFAKISNKVPKNKPKLKGERWE